MADFNPESILQKLAGRVSADSLAGFTGVIQLELTGEKTGVWHAVIENQKYEIQSGATENPTLSLICDSGDFAELIAGRLDIMRSFMTGKLKITGDMSMAMRLAGNLNI